ncbi:hypothetical protein JW321_24310, partial [Pseudomonas syringae pv. papulans]|nr:hypothetical protein [Pseudomonas syringae pv. papulans]
WRNQVFDQFPRCVGEFVTLCHAGLQPIMAAILPAPTFRTKPSNCLMSELLSAGQVCVWRVSERQYIYIF